MYRVYADDPTARINLGIRRRLAPLLNNGRRKIELLNSLLLSLPGTPILYYGDEIGMGDNFYLGDRNGVRTPMQWSGDRNAGFSKANPQKLFLPVIIDPEYHYESVNVEAQQHNASSLLWWMRRLISLRKQHPAFGRGTFEWVEHDNPKVLAYLREYEGESLLVAANLSRFSQAADLRMEGFRGTVPLELFGRTHFPPIGGETYPMTFAPHGFYWFLLEPEEEVPERMRMRTGPGRGADEIPELRPRERWHEVFEGRRRGRLEERLVEYIRRQRWYAGKGREIRTARIQEVVPLDRNGARIALLRVEYVGEEPERYLVPLAFSSGDAAERIRDEHPEMVVCRVSVSSDAGILHDALADPSFSTDLLDMVARRRELPGEAYSLAGSTSRSRAEIAGSEPAEIRPALGRAEQSNSSVRFGDRWIMKLFRRVESGVNQDLEIGQFLAEVDFPHSPAIAGHLEFRKEDRPLATAAVLHEFVPNQGDAWEHTLDSLVQFFEGALASDLDPGSLPQVGDVLQLAAARTEAVERPPEGIGTVIGPYLGSARTLGRTTGELHVALASRPELEAFRPEPFGALYQRSLYQSTRNLLGSSLDRLNRRIGRLPDEEQELARRVLGLRSGILERFRELLDRKLEGRRIRCHGDYHLGQVLFTGRDFRIIDFEGEPDRPLSERKLKRSPLRDAAGMLRSFDYAARTVLRSLPERGLVQELDHSVARPWSRLWTEWVSVEFLAGYLSAVEGRTLIPETPEGRALLLDLFLLEKALYELGYELNNRPDWARIPLEGILSLMSPNGDGHPE